MQPVMDSKAIPCKVCGQASVLFDVVDFNQNGLPEHGVHPLTGIPVYYHRCGSCGLIFTTFCDGWGAEEFKSRIYNEEYIKKDPDYLEVRPSSNARAVAGLFRRSRGELGVLDYGGGNGCFARVMREEGFACVSYDPYGEGHALPKERFDLVSCFEVLEHEVAPRAMARKLAGAVKEQGGILMSTLLQPADIEARGLRWWYAMPRSGHITLYTAEALRMLSAAEGMQVGSLSENLHFAWREVPPFAAHLFAQGEGREESAT